jgi:hypothetical protein
MREKFHHNPILFSSTSQSNLNTIVSNSSKNITIGFFYFFVVDYFNFLNLLIEFFYLAKMHWLF